MPSVLAINAGSSSLKFQLFQMPEEHVLARGIIDRIGLNDSTFTIIINGEKNNSILHIADHEEAVKLLLAKLTAFGGINSLDDIDAIGHRVVHGGEEFSESVKITDKVIHVIEE